MKNFISKSVVVLSLGSALAAFCVEPRLLMAIQCGDINAAKYFLAQEKDINGNIGGHSALLMAILADQNNAELVKLLVENGADVNIKHNGAHILIAAISRGNMDVIKLLVDAGANVNATDKKGMPAWYYTAATNNVPAAELLMSKGANIPVDMAAFPAVAFGSVEFVDFLLGKGLDVNAVFHGKPLVFIAAAQEKNLRMVKFLISKGANINVKDDNGKTPLHIAAENNRDDTVKFLLSKGADVNAKDKDGLTPLQLAQKKNSALTVMLLSGEVDEKFKDGSDNTALHITAKFDMPDQAAKLLAKGVDINAKNKDGMTPLHIAAMNDNAKVAQLLLAKGARQLKNKNGENPLHVAAMNNSGAVAKLLLENGAKPNVKDKKDRTPLAYAVEKNHVDVVKELVDHGANVNIKADMGESQDKTTDGKSKRIKGTLIECALLKKHFDIAKLLINAKDAKINFTPQEFVARLNELPPPQMLSGAVISGYLSMAAEANNADVVALLLQKINVENLALDAGNALCIAAKNGNTDICKLLLDTLNGLEEADKKDTPNGHARHRRHRRRRPQLEIDKKNTPNGMKADIDKLFIVGVAMGNTIVIPVTPLHEAVKGGNIDCVKLLLDQGADVNRQVGEPWGDGNTPLHHAVQNKDPKIAVALTKLLMDKGAKAGLTKKKKKKAVDLTKNEDIIELLDGAE